MSRILLMIVFVLWMAWDPRSSVPPDHRAWSVALFLGVYIWLIVLLATWGRILIRRMGPAVDPDRLFAFHRAGFLSRGIVVAWFAVGLFSLGWGHLIADLFRGTALRHFELPAAWLATAPAILAWIGLWWASYPVERAAREHNALGQLEDGLPVHAPPTLWAFLMGNLRTQLLFTLVPIILIIGAGDAVTAVLLRLNPSIEAANLIQGGSMIVMAGLFFVFSPELLRRVLETQPLPPSPLRDRLEEICRRHGVRYREILLWRTEHTMGNAAVMGLIPQVRYVLMSDLLIERLTDEQIEAVFAHELGHIVHRHLTWYAVFILCFTVLLSGPLGWLANEVIVATHSSESRLVATLVRYQETIGMIGGILAFLAAFGFLSRRIERQADVFAARTIQEEKGFKYEISNLKFETPSIQNPKSEIRNSNAPVGPHGAAVFASALQRVAAINHMPTRRYRPRSLSPLRWLGYILELGVDFAQSWLHGTIRGRCDFITSLPADARRTFRFDRRMKMLYAGLIVLLVLSAGAAAIM